MHLSYFLFKDQTKSWDSFEKYVTATSLIQMAIDLHERIPINENTKMKEVEKQLTVLVGDYFSGMYYYILSELEDVDMIQIIAKSIKGINEEKMNVYYLQFQTLELLMHSITKIESAFYDELLTYQNKPEWRIIVQQYLLANRLHKEKQLMKNNEQSFIQIAVKEYCEKHHINMDLYEWINTSYEQTAMKLYEEINLLNMIDSTIGKWMLQSHMPMMNTIAINEGLR